MHHAYHSSSHDVPPSPGGDPEMYGDYPGSHDHPDAPEEPATRADQPEDTGREDDQRGSRTIPEDDTVAAPRGAPGPAIHLPAGVLPSSTETGDNQAEAIQGGQNDTQKPLDEGHDLAGATEKTVVSSRGPEGRADLSTTVRQEPVLPDAVDIDTWAVPAPSAQDVVAAGREGPVEGEGQEGGVRGDEKADPGPSQLERSHNGPPAPPGRRPPGLEGQEPDESDLRERAMLQAVVGAMLLGENRDPNPHRELTSDQAYEHAIVTDIIDTLGAFASLGPRDISYIPDDLLHRPSSTQRLEHNMRSVVASTVASSDPVPPELAGFDRMIATLYSGDFLQTLQDESEFAHAVRVLVALHELEDRREGGILHGRPVPSPDEHFDSQMLSPAEMEGCVQPLIGSIAPDPEGAADFSVNLSGPSLFSTTTEKAIALSILVTAQELVLRHVDPDMKRLMSPTEIWRSVEVWDRAHITARENGLESETAGEAIGRVMDTIRRTMRQNFGQQHQEFLATARMSRNRRKEG